MPNGVSPKLATSSFGQDEPAATPLQMTMAAGAIANKRRDHDAARDGRDAATATARCSTRYKPKPWLTRR